MALTKLQKICHKLQNKCHSKDTLPMPRVSQSARNHIIRAFQDGLDFISLANDLHLLINRRTDYRIVQTFQRENRRHCLPVTGRHKILTAGMVNSLVSFVEEKPDRNSIGNERTFTANVYYSACTIEPYHYFPYSGWLLLLSQVTKISAYSVEH